jgi:hypothetical protein
MVLFERDEMHDCVLLFFCAVFFLDVLFCFGSEFAFHQRSSLRLRFLYFHENIFHENIFFGSEFALTSLAMAGD